MPMSHSAWAWTLGTVFLAGLLVWTRIAVEMWQLGTMRREMAEQSKAFLLLSAEIEAERKAFDREMRKLAAMRHDIEREAVALREAHEALTADRAQLDADTSSMADQTDMCVRALNEALGLMRLGAHDEAEELLAGLAQAGK